jgi:hypothetical protein
MIKQQKWCVDKKCKKYVVCLMLIFFARHETRSRIHLTVACFTSTFNRTPIYSPIHIIFASFSEHDFFKDFPCSLDP